MVIIRMSSALDMVKKMGLRPAAALNQERKVRGLLIDSRMASTSEERST
jgi:hypothetical protein